MREKIQTPSTKLQRSTKLKKEKSRALVGLLLVWFDENARDLPWRKTRDPYAIWVSEIMLQQTQVKAVIPYWERWMKVLPDIQTLAKASPERIHKLWEGLGYYTRVRNMQRAAQKIVVEHGGVFPREYEQILNLPGIGRYTAGAICSIAFNQPAPILDGNVTRVLARCFGIRANVRDKKTQAKLWSLAEELVRTAAPHSCSILNQSLMELGALMCTPRNPACAQCPLRDDCVAYRHNLTERVPALPTRPKITPRRFVAFVLQKNGALFVRQRPVGVVNAHLWEFPNLEVFPGDGDLQAAAHSALGLQRLALEPLCQIRHSITRYAISLEAYRIEMNGQTIKTEGKWVNCQALRHLPFCSAHKKVLAAVKNFTPSTCPHPGQ